MTSTPHSASRPGLAQLVYRSRATHPPTREGVQALLAQARERNAREHITGLLVLDGDCFFQWLEGPPEGVQRVWEAIRRDPRHHEVERLHTPWRTERLFADWRMQWATVSTEPWVPGAWALPVQAAAQVALQEGDVAAYLQGLGLWGALPPPETMAAALTAEADTEAQALVARVAALAPDVQALGTHLLGPVSRAMADAWRDDRCTSTQLLVAQGRLQGLMRRINADVELSERLRHTALVALWPGETHVAGVSFAGVALDCAGWAVQCAFPAHVAELEALVRQQPLDLLHIAVSPLFCREDQLPLIAAALHRLRRAAANPQMLLVLGGQAFQELPGLAVVLGADGAGLAEGSTQMDVRRMLRWNLQRRHSPGAMLAQGTLNDVALHMRRRLFGAASEEGHAPRDATG